MRRTTKSRLKQVGATMLCLLATLGTMVAAGGCGDCDLKIKTGELPEAAIGRTYDFRMKSECGGDTWFLVDGNLPPGISFQSTGKLLGIPTRPGWYSFTVGVEDVPGNTTAYRGLSLLVVP